MEGPIGSRDNVFKSVHHLEGARGLSADDLANHINTALLAPMEVFEPLTHNPFRGDITSSVCQVRIFATKLRGSRRCKIGKGRSYATTLDLKVQGIEWIDRKVY